MRSFSNFIVGVNGRSITHGDFVHKAACEKHLSGLKSLKGGSVELVPVEGHLVVCVGVGENPTGTAIRDAVANGVRKLRTQLNNNSNNSEQQQEAAVEVGVDPMGNPQAAVEGAVLGSYVWNMKSKAEDIRQRQLQFKFHPLASSVPAGWNEGLITARAECDARTLANMPANTLPPRVFGQWVEDRVADIKKERPELADSLQVTVFDEHWVKSQNMNGVLTVGKGSEEPVRFLQIVLKGDANAKFPSDDKPSSGSFPDLHLALVGKGVCFDSGGISLKPSANMGDMKGDMQGGACVVNATLALWQLRVPINVLCVVPLVENMPSGRAARPGDVYAARNGITIEVDNTDAEGRLILADALHYCMQNDAFPRPHHMIDVATLTGAIGVALGDACVGCFTNRTELWNLLDGAGAAVGQPFWRMPLMSRYAEMMKSDVADLINAAPGGKGGACTAAAFLQHFIADCPAWAHLDIAGVMQAKGADGVLAKGMTGIPTRTLIEVSKRIVQAMEVLKK